VLADKVNQFNQQHVQQLDTLRGLYPSNTLDNLNRFANIEDYTNQVKEGLDRVINPIINLIIINTINLIEIRVAN